MSKISSRSLFLSRLRYGRAQWESMLPAQEQEGKRARDRRLQDKPWSELRRFGRYAGANGGQSQCQTCGRRQNDHRSVDRRNPCPRNVVYEREGGLRGFIQDRVGSWRHGMNHDGDYVNVVSDMRPTPFYYKTKLTVHRSLTLMRSIYLMESSSQTSCDLIWFSKRVPGYGHNWLCKVGCRSLDCKGRSSTFPQQCMETKMYIFLTYLNVLTSVFSAFSVRYVWFLLFFFNTMY